MQGEDVTLLQCLYDFSITCKLLGGNTPLVETGATDLGRLEDNDFQTFLGRMTSGAVATRPRADNDEISLDHSSTVYM